MRQFTVGSLFAGIGGIDLGFERAGFMTKWQVEIDPFCRRVLEKHFAHAERFEDVRTVGSHNLPAVDVIVGGFPCQDISHAGRQAGIEGQRSGLWREYARIIGELRPHYVFVENVSALLQRGMGRVVGDLAKIGYDAEWETHTAHESVGASHLRDRVYIVAYSRCLDGQTRLASQWSRGEVTRREVSEIWSKSRLLPKLGTALPERICSWLSRESGMARMAYGVSNGVDRRSSLGNAVVPQVAELYANQIAKRLAQEVLF